ncbi:MAG: alpha/beta hydrolase, partial [Bacteroidota bacterium]
MMKGCIKRLSIFVGAVLLLLIAGAVSYVNQLGFLVPEGDAMEILSGLSHTPREEVIEYEGQPVHTVEIGDPEKPTLMFVHGSPGDWGDFSRYLTSPVLLERFHMIAVTRPGYAKSGDGEHEPSLEKQAAALLHVLERRSPGAPALLVGHSFGGPVIARMAMDAPEKVASLLLLSASIDPALEDMKWYQYPAAAPPISWLIPTSLLVCNREILALEPELEAMMPLWANIRQPVTVIHGDEDKLVPVANAD